MFSYRVNKKYILIVIVFLIFLFSLWLIISLFPPALEYLPVLPTKPTPIAQTKKIYDLGADHQCQISPFSQTVSEGSYSIYQVALLPSYENSPYELEFGGLPKGVIVDMPIKRGRGDDQIYFKAHYLLEGNSGSFTLTLAYHEYQLGKFKWLTNYCLFNINLL